MSSQNLARWGVIGVEGDDAISFLQAQLSNDVAGMTEGQLRLAGLCNAKGRLLGSFFMLRQATRVYLLCRSDTVPSLVKRLGMFVLRSKCKVIDLSASHHLEFQADSGLDAPMRVRWDENGSATASLRMVNGRLPGVRFAVGPVESSEPEADDAFEWVLQQLGIAYVSQATVEMFIPQAVNLDLVGGVSFSKGCYPGQEVVARSHYLGKLKRRSFLASAAASLDFSLAGQDVWLEGKTNEPVGQVVTSVASAGQQHLLVELPIDEAEQTGATFTLKMADGEIGLNIKHPPYDIHGKGNAFEAA